MDFLILRREKVKSFTYETHERKYAIISIHDPDKNPISFHRNNELFSILNLSFWDAEDETGISEEDAKSVVKFVNYVKDKVGLIVVNCEAGMCRSAGVCAAISKYLNFDDMWVFTNPKYYPNSRCYNFVLNAFGINDPEWINKILLNRNLKIEDGFLLL